MAQKYAIEIRADRVKKTACPKCGNVVDGSGVPPFSILQCDKCQTKFASPGRLGGFVLLKELGRGQMGVTYKAYEKVLGRYVAIKVMRSTLGGDPNRVKEFMAEGRALASLDHPNAVRIYSIGQEKDQPYIAMELVNGRSVGQHMGPDGKLPEARSLEIATGIARALKAACEIGLIHSDVKPDNIVLDEKGRAKLVDFGIARFGPGKLEADAAIGTPYYVAPEQVQRGSVDHRTDIYSLGVTLYHMIAGQPPFPGTDLQTVLDARIKKSAPSLMKSCRRLHMETVHVVAKMLQRDPNRRYQNYDDLLRDLRRACWASGAELTQEADDAPINMASPGHGMSMGKMVIAAAVLMCVVGVGAWAMFGGGGGFGDGSNTTTPGVVDQVADPVFSPQGRTIAEPTKISVSCDTPRSRIHYTTDGSEPTSGSKAWADNATIEVKPGTTLRARAFRKNMSPSRIVQSVYKSDSVVVADVVEIKGRAKEAWKAVDNLDDRQGFDEKIDACGEIYAQAVELYNLKAFEPAKGKYNQVLALCEGLKKLDAQRKAADASRRKTLSAIKGVPDFHGAATWKAALNTNIDAGKRFEAGEFSEAEKQWGNVIGQINQAYEKMLPGERKAYDDAFKACDIELLNKHGRQAWANVQLTLKHAEKFKLEKQFGPAVQSYKKALTLLAKAKSDANTALLVAELQKSIKSIEDLINAKRYYEAKIVLEPVLAKAPKKAELLKLKAAIDYATEVKIRLQPGAKEEKGGLIMTLRLVTSGKFTMGSPEDEPERDKKFEVPHKVKITKPFYMGQYEVTYSQFKCFVEATGYKTAAENPKTGRCLVLVKGKLRMKSGQGRSWKNPGFNQSPAHPVVCVSWDDAKAFCNWLTNRAAGMTISLPTEAQWEYACRQGYAGMFSFGDDIAKLREYGNYNDKSSPLTNKDSKNSDGQSATAPVGSFKSADKLPQFYDMHGNAGEWCRDYYAPYLVNAKPDPTGPRSGVLHAVRGGSWASRPSRCRSAARVGMRGLLHSALIGFRVVAIPAEGKDRPSDKQLLDAAVAAPGKDANLEPLKPTTAKTANVDPLPDFTKPFTLTAWVLTPDNGKGTIFAKMAPKGKWVSGGKSLYVANDGKVYYDSKDGGRVVADFKVSDGKWHHVALVSDGRRHDIYIDGQHKGRSDLNAKPDPKDSVGKIGFTAIDFPNPGGFTGKIDEVCVYNRALSEQEAKATAKAIIRPKKGLVGCWTFESGGLDSSGNANHGRVLKFVSAGGGRRGMALRVEKGIGAMIIPRRR